eukprot:jgi/Psemu1/306640/fgenesh1_kg.270_\
MLSPQAFQVLQEVSAGQTSPSAQSSNSFVQENFSVASYFGGSSYAEGTSRYEESTLGMESRMSGANSESVATESVISSLHDEVSSAMGSDVGLPPLGPEDCSSSSSSWFRFGSKKSKFPTSNDSKTNCETMASVQETEVLSDDGMLPTPTKLFSLSQDMGDETAKTLQKDDYTGNNQEETDSEGSTSPPSTSRNWFGFRKSSNSPGPGGKERSQSPSTSFSLSTMEDLSIKAQPEGFPDAATEASIEITLSIPASGESDDTVTPLNEKPATTSLQSRPSASWFGFRRSSKSSSGSKGSHFHTDSLTKGAGQAEMPYHPGLKSAPTERTAMDDDWLQEVISDPTGNTNDFDPWLNEKEQTKSVENEEKSSNTSRGQASWFGFKRSKATSSNKVSPLNSELDAADATQDPFENHAWDSDAPLDTYWYSEASNAPIPCSDENRSKTAIDGDYEYNHYGNSNDIFRPRARLPTESTLPSVSTEERSDEEASVSDGSTKDYDFGAVESFNFLKI